MSARKCELVDARGGSARECVAEIRAQRPSEIDVEALRRAIETTQQEDNQ